MTNATNKADKERKLLEKAQESGAPIRLAGAPVEATRAASEAHEAVTAALESAEKVSESASKAREQKSEKAAAGTQKKVSATEPKPFTVPESQKVLISTIDKELTKQLKKLQKEESKARGGLFRRMDAEKLARIVAAIRKVQKLLSELVFMTLEALKNLYRTLFQPRGL